MSINCLLIDGFGGCRILFFVGRVVVNVVNVGTRVAADCSNVGCERQKIQEMPRGSTFDNKPGGNETFQTADLAG